MHCPAAEDVNKRYLNAIISRLKTRGGLIRFAFVTGISKSIHTILGTDSDLTDITKNPDFHDITGLMHSDLNDQ